VVTPPTPFTGTGDPNDFDTLVGGAPTSGNFNGTSGNDVLTGDGGNQNISGNQGNDVIYGGGGNDNINGNQDNDQLYGQAGTDTLDGNGGDDTLYGGTGNDTLTGSNENDTLYGGSGSDVLNGSNGNDILIGGYGADTFVYLDLKDTNDTILDFMDAGNDQIDLSAIDANPAMALDQVFGWGGTTPTANSLWFTESGGNTTLYGDTDGNAATAEFMILLPGYTGFNAYGSPLSPPPDITF
jgi:Ca2+-binding RTX toxin-like protein